MKKHLLIALCMAVSASCLAQQPSNTRLLKEESKSVYSSDENTSTSSYYREYIYGENGWPVKQTEDGEDYRYYEFELNSAGYATKVATYRQDNAGEKYYNSRIDYTYNADNKVLKKTVYGLTYLGSPSYVEVLKPKTEYFYEYDSDPDGTCCERREYNITNDKLSYVEKKVWLKDANCYIGHSSIKQRDYEQISLDYDPAQILFTEKFYKKDEADHTYLYQHNLYSFYDDGTVKETLYQEFDNDGNLVYVSGGKNDVTKDAATNLYTVVMYTPQIENGAVTYSRNHEYKASANVYYGLPLTYENGNRYQYVIYPNEETTENIWLAPNLLVTRSTNATTITYTTDKGNEVKEKLYQTIDGTYTAFLNVNPDENDKCDKIIVVDEQMQKLVRIIRKNRKGFENASNRFLCTLEEKVGENWKPFANNNVCDGKNKYMYVTDEQGRVKENRMYERDGSYNQITEFTYNDKGGTSTSIYLPDYKYVTNEYIVDGNTTTNISYKYDSNQNKYPTAKTVKEKLNDGYKIKTLSYKYDRDASQWIFSKGEGFDFEDMADGFMKSIKYEVMADGSQVPIVKYEYKRLPEGSDEYAYKWDSDQNDWVGVSGYSEWKYPEAEFKYKMVSDKLFHYFDPVSANNYLTVGKPCYKGEMIMNKTYIWDAASKSWKTKTANGYELSEDGKMLTYKDMKMDDAGVINHDKWYTWKINDNGLLIESNSYDYGIYIGVANKVINSDSYQYDDAGNLLCLTAKQNNNDKTEIETTTTYTYGQIATGIGQTTVGGLSINGRTFILNGAQLALYNTAGQCVATGIGQVTAPTPGVYVLKSGHMSWKMMMK